jgi:hypothetical protein
MRSNRVWQIIGIGAVVLFIGSIFWSIWFETLLPLLRAGDTAGLSANLIGIPIILAGTAVFCYGGFTFVRATFSVFGDLGALPKHEAKQFSQLAQQEKGRRVRALLWKAWQRPLLWLALGFGLIAVGGFIINRPL